MAHESHEAVQLVQVWVTRVDASGRSRLEARWAPSAGTTTTTPHYTTHAA